jgi:hypothetical protein
MFAGLVREEFAAGLDAVVLEILAEAGVQEPPVDAFAVARALGITVAVDDCQSGRARYVRLSAHRGLRARPTILLRSDPRAERCHWAVAHEIGEHAAYRVFARFGVEAVEAAADAREAVANQLAGRLLLPTPWFEADAARCGWDLICLKARYGTASHELLARRMLECGPPVIISIFDQRRLSFRRSNVAGRVPPLSMAERDCWREVHNAGRPQETCQGTCTIRGWPVHEEQWKREILRTELSEFADCGGE